MKNKKGNPTSINNIKNRRHSVTLNEKAEYLLRQLCKQRGEFNLSRFLSETIIDVFEDNFVADLNMELIRVSDLQAEYLERQQELIKQIRRIKSSEENKIKVQNV